MQLHKKSIFGPWPFYRGALGIAVPIMLQQLIQSLVSLIDNFMVSGLGDICMSGVNVAGQMLFIFMVYLNTVCMAGGIFMTQFYGAEDRSGMRQAFRFKLITGLAAFIPYLLVCVAFPRQALSLLLIGNTQADLILDEAVRYIRIMAFIGVPMTLSVCIATSLRDMGKVKTPLLITVIATLTNTLFNWLLIYGNLGFPRLGVEGAALATVIARALELALFIALYARERPDFAVKPAALLQIDGALFRDILKKGALVLFCEMVWVLSETVTTALYNGRGGADVVSGMSAGWAIVNLLFVSFGGINTATSVIIGKTLGKGQLDEARNQSRWMLSAAVVFGLFMALMGALVTLLTPLVFGHLSSVAQGICRDLVLLVSLYMPLWVYSNVQFSIARAGGDTVMGAVVDGCVTLAVVIPGILLLARFTDWGPVLMYGVLKLTDFIKIIVAHLWLKKEKWVKNLTVQAA